MDDKITKLERLAELRSNQIISEEEFLAQKSRILDPGGKQGGERSHTRASPPVVVAQPVAAAATPKKRIGWRTLGVATVLLAIVLIPAAPTVLRIYRDSQPSKIKEGSRYLSNAEARQFTTDMETIQRSFSSATMSMSEPDTPLETTLGQRVDSILRSYFAGVSRITSEMEDVPIEKCVDATLLVSRAGRAEILNIIETYEKLSEADKVLRQNFLNELLEVCRSSIGYDLTDRPKAEQFLKDYAGTFEGEAAALRKMVDACADDGPVISKGKLYFHRSANLRNYNDSIVSIELMGEKRESLKATYASTFGSMVQSFSKMKAE